MTVYEIATWIALCILGPGSIAVFAAFLLEIFKRDVSGKP